MKILLTRLWEMFSQHIDTANYQSALERHDEHGALGPYSILCRLDQSSANKDRH